jgi:hypothetical protein
LSGIVCGNGRKKWPVMGARFRHLAATGIKDAGLLCVFYFSQPTENPLIFVDISPLSLKPNASSSLRQGKVQFCQFFGMNGAVFY